MRGIERRRLRPERTRIYNCDVCGMVILHELPTGLKGQFRHLRCAESEHVKREK